MLWAHCREEQRRALSRWGLGAGSPGTCQPAPPGELLLIMQIPGPHTPRFGLSECWLGFWNPRGCRWPCLRARSYSSVLGDPGRERQETKQMKAVPPHASRELDRPAACPEACTQLPFPSCSHALWVPGTGRLGWAAWVSAHRTGENWAEWL